MQAIVAGKFATGLSLQLIFAITLIQGHFFATTVGLKQSDQIAASSTDTQTGNSKPAVIGSSLTNPLEARSDNEQNFIKDILDRLHALDADIGKLLYNSTSMYAPDYQSAAFQEGMPKGGERFSEVLQDLDSLQDEIGGLVSNATRARQYNMLVRLRPLNTILYRIRHNLHLMRNSLVTINAVSSLEKLGNTVLDSTLQAFMRPDANVSDEFDELGNFDINLDKPNETESTRTSQSTTILSTTLNATNTTRAPSPMAVVLTSELPTTKNSTTLSIQNTTPSSLSTRRPGRRTNNRNQNRRNNTTSSRTTTTTTTIASASSKPATNSL